LFFIGFFFVLVFGISAASLKECRAVSVGRGAGGRRPTWGDRPTEEIATLSRHASSLRISQLPGKKARWQLYLFSAPVAAGGEKRERERELEKRRPESRATKWWASREPCPRSRVLSLIENFTLSAPLLLQLISPIMSNSKLDA
jgi:hypothetical protein